MLKGLLGASLASVFISTSALASSVVANVSYLQDNCVTPQQCAHQISNNVSQNELALVSMMYFVEYAGKHGHMTVTFGNWDDESRQLTHRGQSCSIDMSTVKGISDLTFRYDSQNNCSH